MEACRACLSNAEDVVPFDDNLINGYNLLTNLNIKPLDGLSQHVCEICFNTVISFLNFREQCITSESTLQQKLSQTIKSEPSEIQNTIVKTETSVKRRVGRPRKETSSKGYEKLDTLNKNDTTTEPPLKRRVGRPRRNTLTTKITNNTWVVRPRQNTTTLDNVSNGCVTHARKDTTKTNSKSWVICPRKDMSTHKTQSNGLASEIILNEKNITNDVDFDVLTQTEDVMKICDLAIKEEIESSDGNSVVNSLDTAASDIETEVDISNNLVIREHIKDVSQSKIIKPVNKKIIKPVYKNDKNKETSIPCGLCKKRLEDQESLSSHLESHRTGSRCETCQETFAEWQALLAHRLVHVKSRKSHKCHICLKPQWSPLFFEYHYLSEHSDKNIQDVKMTCKICLKKYSGPQKMKRHWKNNHKDVRYSCEKCPKAFAYKFELRKHERIHYNDRPFVCDICEYSSKFKNSLHVHILRNHTESSVNCSKCSRVFRSKERFEGHVCPVKKEEVCSICGIVTRCLRRHMRVHSDVRRFSCARCEATFKTKGALQVHINKHDDLRPHGCEFCPMRFNSPTVLIKHRRVHTGEKPYVCKVCAKGFTGNHNLKVHMRVHGEDLVVKRNAPLAPENMFLLKKT